MFEEVADTLEATIAALDIPVDAAALARCLGLLDQLTAKVTDGVSSFDRAEAWRASGAVSMTAWLRSAGSSPRDAHVLATTAKRLDDLPVLAAAYRDGDAWRGSVAQLAVNLTMILAASAGAYPQNDLADAVQLHEVVFLNRVDVGKVGDEMFLVGAETHDFANARSAFVGQRVSDGCRKLSGLIGLPLAAKVSQEITPA